MTNYKNPAVAVDLVPLAVKDGVLHVALDTRANEPFKGDKALPGVLVGAEETVAEATARAARKVGVNLAGEVAPLMYRDNPARDERFRVLSLPHVVVADGGEDGVWVPLGDVMETDMPFDHQLIVQEAAEWLSRAVEGNPEFIGRLFGGKVTVPAVSAMLQTVDPERPVGGMIRVLRRVYEETDDVVHPPHGGRPAQVFVPR